MNGLLKFITCGSVDDGKSTLIGHMLYDAKLLFADQKRGLELDSKVGSRGGKIDYSLLLDGLMAEREQGITIDVAYRYFTTDRRSFIVADTPGHEEYTRNMAVGASFAELAVILVDASQGVLIQTRRHTRICALMGIRHFVFAVNKMDLVDYDEKTFRAIEKDIHALARETGYESIKIIPVSATEGDNITKNSPNMPWYTSSTLQSYLETVDVDSADTEKGFTMPVQRVCRPDLTFRGFQGTIESGAVRVGDVITSLPSGENAEVVSIIDAGKKVDMADKGHAVTIQLNREVDISRGCVLVARAHPSMDDQFTVKLLWMDDVELAPGKNYLLRLGTEKFPATVLSIEYKIDVNTGAQVSADHLSKNELAVCTISTAEKLVYDKFEKNPALGSFILIDRVSHMTSACGVVVDNIGTKDETGRLDRARRANQKGQKPKTIWISGTDAADAAAEVERRLFALGHHTMLLTNWQSAQAMEDAARLLMEAGLVVVAASNAPCPGGRDFLPARAKDGAETIAEVARDQI